MTDQQIRDLRTLDYVLDDGQRVSVTMCEFESLSGKFHGGRDMSVTIDVDGVNRLTADDHYSTIADFGLGEFMLQPIMVCLGAHLASWASWQQFQLFLDDDDRTPVVETGDVVPVYTSNLAARHIETLDDAQAWFWVADPSLAEGISNRGGLVGAHLAELADKVWDEWKELNKDKLAELEEKDSARRALKALTDRRIH